LPVAIVILLHLSLEMFMKGAEISREPDVVRVVGFGSHESLEFFDVVKRIAGGAIADLWQRSHWCEELAGRVGVFED